MPRISKYSRCITMIRQFSSRQTLRVKLSCLKTRARSHLARQTAFCRESKRVLDIMQKFRTAPYYPRQSHVKSLHAFNKFAFSQERTNIPRSTKTTISQDRLLIHSQQPRLFWSAPASPLRSCRTTSQLQKRGAQSPRGPAYSTTNPLTISYIARIAEASRSIGIRSSTP